MNRIIDMLAEGDLRTVGRVSEIIKLVVEKPELFSEVIQAMTHADPGIRMRAADAVEKITRNKPEFLQAFKPFLLTEALEQTQQEVRWHVVQLVPRLELSPKERSQAAMKIFSFLDDASKIVQTNSLQALVDLAWEDDELFKQVKTEVERLVDAGSPAVSNRADKLFHELDQPLDP